MRFQVPQFIEMEDKIFGPFSFKEFIYIAGGGGISYIIYRFIPSFYLSIIFIVPIMALAVALAFYKVNNRPFIDVLQSALVFLSGHKLYIWKKTKKTSVSKKTNDIPEAVNHSKSISIGVGKLSDLNRQLDLAGSKTDENIDDLLI